MRVPARPAGGHSGPPRCSERSRGSAAPTGSSPLRQQPQPRCTRALPLCTAGPCSSPAVPYPGRSRLRTCRGLGTPSPGAARPSPAAPPASPCLLCPRPAGTQRVRIFQQQESRVPGVCRLPATSTASPTRDPPRPRAPVTHPGVGRAVWPRAAMHAAVWYCRRRSLKATSSPSRHTARYPYKAAGAPS